MGIPTKVLHNHTAKLYTSRDVLEFSGRIITYNQQSRRQGRRVLERALRTLDRIDARS